MCNCFFATKTLILLFENCILLDLVSENAFLELHLPSRLDNTVCYFLCVTDQLCNSYGGSLLKPDAHVASESEQSISF